MKALALLLVLALSGCAVQERARHLEFTFEGPEADQAAFVEALSEWNQCGFIYGDLVARGGIPVYVGTPIHEHALASTTIADDKEVIKIVYKEDTPEWLRSLFAHELGHAFRGDGLHTANGLMAKGRTTPDVYPNCDYLDL